MYCQTNLCLKVCGRHGKMFLHKKVGIYRAVLVFEMSSDVKNYLVCKHEHMLNHGAPHDNCTFFHLRNSMMLTKELVSKAFQRSYLRHYPEMKKTKLLCLYVTVFKHRLEYTTDVIKPETVTVRYAIDPRI